jgi:threonine dehydrogenase-like Zn-dependent dehydrogenase
VKAIVNTGPDRLEMRELPRPEPGAGQVRVRTAACGICATDLRMIAGWPRTPFGAIPGHEWSGVVDAVGAGVSQASVGRKCVADNVLSDGGEIGFEHPGGYAQYFLTEAKNVLVLPDDLDAGVAALIEPLAVSVRGVRRLRVERKGGAVIFGDGPIGLLLLMLLKRAGVCPLCMVGGRPARLSLASDLGADVTLNYHDIGRNVAAEIRKEVEPGRVSYFIEASGSAAALDAGIALASGGATILVIGDYGESAASFRWNTLLLKELEIIGSNASADAWPEALRIACDPSFGLGRLVTHRLPATIFADGIALVRSREEGVVKVVLDWTGI